MSTLPATSPAYFIGWDVGGWNCDKNGKSRDALVILDANRRIIGQPWRGNLRLTINSAADSVAFASALFERCGAQATLGDTPITLAIDTPLGFSQEFVRLVTILQAAGALGSSDTNPYLFRQTERWLFEHRLKPLSAIKDMIGSQATKGMHVLARFAPTMVRCGVWQGGALTAIEAYPSACKNSLTVSALQEPFGKLAHDDLDDALTCALVAWLFSAQPEKLASPAETVPLAEGWIWVPQDAVWDSSSPQGLGGHAWK
ncbi:MAG: hypothetical protein KFB96_11240 [Thiocapsa sp.]|uniref:hypothetical protein n=1 Tax=Thiocapsa sp. TaxID=2024551 RepID=UPI001BCB7A4A|nr:hypothetical protein [Thiocapsa sp.]QVL50919.1 MAG: hypothetical protein KFB96_11240 [Thiocapsa sp.]